MNPGTPWVIGSFKSMSLAGDGESPTSPDPFKEVEMSLALTTVRNDMLSKQFFSKSKHILSLEGCPAIAPLPY